MFDRGFSVCSVLHRSMPQIERLSLALSRSISSNGIHTLSIRNPSFVSLKWCNMIYRPNKLCGNFNSKCGIAEHLERLCPRRRSNMVFEYTISEALLSVTLLRFNVWDNKKKHVFPLPQFLKLVLFSSPKLLYLFFQNCSQQFILLTNQHNTWNTSTSTILELRQNIPWNYFFYI